MEPKRSSSPPLLLMPPWLCCVNHEKHDNFLKIVSKASCHQLLSHLGQSHPWHFCHCGQTVYAITATQKTRWPFWDAVALWDYPGHRLCKTHKRVSWATVRTRLSSVTLTVMPTFPLWCWCWPCSQWQPLKLISCYDSKFSYSNRVEDLIAYMGTNTHTVMYALTYTYRIFNEFKKHFMIWLCIWLWDG